jgi:hypothetical protein
MRVTRAIPLCVAFILTAAYVAVVPTLAYSTLVAASIARSGDMGGPLNFILIPAAGLVVGAIVGAVLLLLSPLFHKVGRMALFVPFVVGLLAFILALAWSHSAGYPAAGPMAFSLFVSFWFGSASLLFIVIDLVIRRIATKLRCN